MKTKKLLLSLITPFAYVSKRNLQIMLGIEIFVFLLLWYVCKFAFLPTPSGVFTAFMSMLGADSLMGELITSTLLCLKSMLFATIISAIISYAETVAVFRPISNTITKLRYLSLTGLSFFFTLLSSSGEGLKTSLLVFSITVFFTTSFMNVMKINDEEYIRSRTLGLSPWQTLFEDVIYGKLALLLETVRQTFAIAWMMLTMIEGLVRSSGGIGVLLLNQSKYLHLDSIVAILLIIFLVGILIDWFLSLIILICCPYTKFNKSY